MQVEPSTRFANRALDSGERFLRRRSLYPAELWAHDGFQRKHTKYYCTSSSNCQAGNAAAARFYAILAPNASERSKICASRVVYGMEMW